MLTGHVKAQTWPDEREGEEFWWIIFHCQQRERKSRTLSIAAQREGASSSRITIIMVEVVSELVSDHSTAFHFEPFHNYLYRKLHFCYLILLVVKWKLLITRSINGVGRQSFLESSSPKMTFIEKKANCDWSRWEWEQEVWARDDNFQEWESLASKRRRRVGWKDCQISYEIENSKQHQSTLVDNDILNYLL